MSGNIYRLKDDGYITFKKIVRGTKQIGIVRRTDNGYFAVIGKVSFSAPTEDEAFKEVVARHCGYPNHETMAAKNSAIRADNRVKKAKAKVVVDAIINGDFQPLEELFKKGAV